MRYRPDIDGLRAVAVLSVALFHAGFPFFRGGYIGVDVFFVISGYLITSMILSGLQTESFSVIAFYERRARRLLPALFLVIGVSCVFAYAWMLPTDLEEFGKSVIATDLFSNNMLLLRGANYWALPSEFKPLLHTWSLGIEEQYYLVFPFFLIVCCRAAPHRIEIVFLVAAIASLAGAHWIATFSPTASFYLLPTRAWEFLLGSLVTCAREQRGIRWRGRHPQIASGLGLALIAFSVIWLDRTTATPGPYTLVPTIGTALVLTFAVEGTIVFTALSNPVLTGVGLISYSLYLWHVPVFAFARIYCVDRPSPYALGGLLIAVVPIAYLTWRFVETPVRSGRVIAQGTVFVASSLLALGFLGWGGCLVLARGIPERMYGADIAETDDLYPEYNARPLSLRKDAFTTSGTLKILVVGDSFARDFINMTIETFDLAKAEIVYRNDLDGCIASWDGSEARSLLAQADVIVFATRSFDGACVRANIDYAVAHAKQLFYIGSKHFGANLNWLARLKPDARPNQLNPLLPGTIRDEETMARAIPADHYVSLLRPIVNGGRVPVTDEQGRLITQDRKHLTKFGAEFLGRHALYDSAFGKLLRSF